MQSVRRVFSRRRRQPTRPRATDGVQGCGGRPLAGSPGSLLTATDRRAIHAASLPSVESSVVRRCMVKETFKPRRTTVALRSLAMLTETSASLS